MADIKQAAKWLKDGRKARVASWVNPRHWVMLDESSSGSLICQTGEDVGLDMADILADDWEIAE